MTKLNTRTLYSQNVRDLRTKTNNFCLSTSSSNFDLIGLTEFWLHSGILFDDLSSIYKRSLYLTNQIRWGLFLAIKNTLQVSSVLFPNDLTALNLEILCVKFTIVSNKPKSYELHPKIVTSVSYFIGVFQYSS